MFKNNHEFKSLLMAAAVVVLGMGMVSCVDKADNSVTPSDNPQEQQAQDAQQAKAEKFWAVVSHLVDVDDYTPDYADKTFEPTYGVAQGNDGTRYVYTNTAAAAAERFADLVERDDIDENTQTYTYDDPDVGKLVYTKGTGRNLATVDVDIKQIPTLKKIVYVPGAYANGSFRGRAYYRFGDVVKRPVQDYNGNNVDEYWICVRPSFGLEGKGDSHWVCLNVLPKKNVWHYHSKTNGKDYYLPTGLGTNQEHMQNLAEMLYAIYDPVQWQENVSDIANTGLEMFHDFDKTKYTLHNQYFWKNVQRQWKNKDILKKAFNYTGSEADFKQMLFEGVYLSGLHLLYYGYSWYTSVSWNATLYEAIYMNGAANKEKNMHMANYEKPERHMKEIGFDCRKRGQDLFSDYKTFFNDGVDYRWTVRHATGKELASDGRYDVRTAIRGVEEVYRYYHDVVPTPADAYATTDPEETPEPKGINKDDVQVGNILARSGNFYRTFTEALENQDAPVAMVVYLGGRNRVEKGQPWNGLAISLEDVTDSQGNAPLFMGADNKNVLCTTNIVELEHLTSRRDGLAMTQRLKTHACYAEHSHPAAEMVGAMAAVYGCSDWFLPSTGQWDLAMQGMGFGTGTIYGHGDADGDKWGYDPQSGHWPWAAAGVPGAAFDLNDPNAIYMTCTEYNTYTLLQYDYLFWTSEKCWYVRMGGERIHLEPQFKYINQEPNNYSVHVRPFIAFAYNDGGVTDPGEPCEPLEGPRLKSLVGEDGNFYATSYNAFEATGHMPMAYVVHYDANHTFQVGNKQYHGLALCLYETDYAFQGHPWAYVVNHADTFTDRMTDQVRQQKGFSKWFVPTKDLWQMAFEHGFDCQFNDNAVVEEHAGDSYDRIREFMRKTLHIEIPLRSYYWTATGAEGDDAYVLLFDNDVPVSFITVDKNTLEIGYSMIFFRPMIAF